MIKGLGVCVLSLTTASQALADQKSCAALAAEIAAQLEAKGVKGFKLDIVNAEAVGRRQVVGTCEGGAKKITYQSVKGSGSK